MIDRSKLESLLGGDEAMVRRFLNIFHQQTPQQLKSIKSNMFASKWSEVSITAHAIKSQCRYLGLDEIAQRAYKIEQLSEKELELDLIPGLVVEMEALLEKVIK